MKRPFLLFICFFVPFSVSADTFVSGLISSDTTWSPAGGVYILETGVTVPEGVTLTIEPGTIIKSRVATPGVPTGLYIFGTLIARGTDLEPIYFTSIRDDVGGDTNGDNNLTTPSPIDWVGLTFRPGSTGSIGEISHSVVRYSGAFDGFYRAGIFNYGGIVTIDNVSFENNFQTDIYQNLGSTSITNSKFDRDNFAVFYDGGVFAFSENSLDVDGTFKNGTESTINAINNWWGSETGPRAASNPNGLGTFVYGPVLYDPWLRSPPIDEVERNPVIIIPGIMGSAYKNGELVIDPILHTYDDLIATLIANGYVSGENLFTFPYEWRDSNIFSADLLDDKISEIKTTCACNKVDIVAHSMGGLVARAYIQSVDYDEDVDQLIFLGTPHKGAPKAYLQWEAGASDVDFRNQLVLSFFTAESLKNSYSNVFSYIRNRPILSVQELLPIFDYIKEDGTGSLRKYPNNYPMNNFLENLDSNISTLYNSGVEISNIIGNSGEDKTIERIRVIPTDHAVFWEHGEPEGFGTLVGDNGLERGEGDNTVPAQSSIMPIVVNESIIASHDRIPTVAANRVYKILSGNDSITNIDTGVGLDIKILLLQLLSPIDFVVTAPDGKKVGKDFLTASEFNDIPLAFYSGYQTDEEYISILNPLDGEYKVEVQGTGSGGEYQMLTSYISEEFSTTTETIGITLPNQITNLTVDIDSDNPWDLKSKKEVTFHVMTVDINGAYKLGWIIDKETRDRLLVQAKLIFNFDKKKHGKHKKKVDKIIINLLEKELDLLLKNGRINGLAHTLLEADLKYLINSD